MRGGPVLSKRRSGWLSWSSRNYAITGRHPMATELQAGSDVFMDSCHGNLVPEFEGPLHVLSLSRVRPCGSLLCWEHALFDVDERLDAQPGDQVRIQCGYAPTTVNLDEVRYVVAQRTVVDGWSVFPRGPSAHGLLGLLAP